MLGSTKSSSGEPLKQKTKEPVPSLSGALSFTRDEIFKYLKSVMVPKDGSKKNLETLDLWNEFLVPYWK